jgi:micrococcal nuclease
MFIYLAKLVRIIDGDTVVLDVDLGFRVHIVETFRLAHINCPELRTIAGKDAKKFTEDWFAKLSSGPSTPIRITSAKPLSQEKYGRWLASISSSDGVVTVLNHALVNAGHAVYAKY